MSNYRARGVTFDHKPIFDETHEQCTVAAWLDLHGIMYCHPANGEWRHPATAKKLKRMGVKPGVPDILIFTPSGLANKPTALELKAVDGATPSKAQRCWLDNLERLGWTTGWAKGADAAIRWLEELGYGRR
jgi:hypothetical protein